MVASTISFSVMIELSGSAADRARRSPTLSRVFKPYEMCHVHLLIYRGVSRGFVILASVSAAASRLIGYGHEK